MLRSTSSLRNLTPFLAAVPFLLVAAASCADGDTIVEGPDGSGTGGTAGSQGGGSGGRGGSGGQGASGGGQVPSGGQDSVGGQGAAGGQAGAAGQGDAGASGASGGAAGSAGWSGQGGVGGEGGEPGAGQGGAGGAGAGGEGGADMMPPTVASNSPSNQALAQPTNSMIQVTFSEEMAPATITATTFTVRAGAVPVLGTVTYANRVARFDPVATLAVSTVYTVRVSSEATDVAGNELAEPHIWTFTTAATPARGPAPVMLGAAANYAILAQSHVSNVSTSVVTGNVGLSPAAASYITGLSLTAAGTHWTSAQVTGRVFAADNAPPTPVNLTTAIASMQAAYTDAATRPTPTSLNLESGNIGGLTLAPGLYRWTSNVIIPTDVTLSGGANDVWIFQITGNLTMASAQRMTLVGDAVPGNVFWQVAGLVEIGTTAHAEGILLSKTAINLRTGASINGRLLAQTAVNIARATVTAP